MKDNFSAQSAAYAQFRPQYPEAMIAHILSHVNNRDAALDVATGNGQVAVLLSPYFDTVYATDISERQIENAVQQPNITYKVEAAENTDFADNQFDLITVAQSIHWFDFDGFYREVDRILKPDGVLAVLGYGLLQTNPASDEILRDFYRNIVGRYWDAERKYVDEHYQTIPFPLDEIPTPKFTNHLVWTFEQLIGYLETWSATQHYIKANGQNPIDLIREKLKVSWENSTKEVVFPLLLRIGKLKNREL
jgi:ubiquinone/menaquinone biosynthesis C-methylase UbiE